MLRDDLTQSLSVLNRGGVILYPTDTVWGLGCDATNVEAVEKIYAIKRRSETQSMLALVDSLRMLSVYVDVIPDSALQLLRTAGGPLSIVYPHAKNLAENLIAADGSAGIRIVKDEPFCRQLIEKFGKPVVSTSANITGERPPGCFCEISGIIKSSADYIVRWRQDDRKQAEASSLVRINPDGTCDVLRGQCSRSGSCPPMKQVDKKSNEV
jgi:L-threonylcarbamoyladenylate synthase